MDRNLSNKSGVCATDEKNVFNAAKRDQILFNRIELEYKRKTKTLQVKGTGTKDIPLALTSSYYDSLEKQVDNLKKQISPLVHSLKSNLIVVVKVTRQGKLLLDSLNIIIKVDFPKDEKLLTTFSEPFRVLPQFADFTDFISVRGHQYQLAVIEATINISLEDFVYVLEGNVVGPKTRKQWLDFATAVYKEGSKQYNLNITVPCVEGELIWDVKEKQIFLQHQERY